MSGRGAKKRGRPPKTSSYEKTRKFQYHLLKKPKYLQQNIASGSLTSTPTASRASSPQGSDISKRSARKPRGGKTHKSKRGGLSNSYSRRGYNPQAADYHESEYHYGSDFGDEDSDKSDIEEDRRSESSTGSGGDGAASDSEFSISSHSTTSGTPKKSSILNRPPSPEPLWLQERQIPPLDLPPSSDDLLIPQNLVFQVVGIYEVLRHFRHLVRLSPFKIEDLCAALSCDEQSNLLIEVHVMLLKALLREEDAQQTHFGPLDHKDSVNITLFLLDVITWPEVLRVYIESDKSFGENILKILNSCEYPFTSAEDRVAVLQFLCNQFLITNPVREDLLSEAPIHYDDHCRVCHRLGDLLCCETCPAVYHLECVDPPLVDVPSEDWQCALCKIHKTTGVTDCLPDAEKQGLLCRHEHLGFDRHGRKFWFIARRLYVEAENGDVSYYSSAQQFEELLDKLDAGDMEAPLARELLELKEEIIRQMAITEKLTNQAKGNRKSYLEVENGNIIKNKKMQSEIFQDQNIDLKLDDTKLDETTLITDSDVVSEVTVTSEDVIQDDEDSDEIKQYKNNNKMKICKKNEDVSERLTRLKSTQILNGTYLFKLGNENNFKNYVNQYSSNPLALNKPQRNEERDKKRYMSHKFSLSGPEFKWSGMLNASKTSLISTLRQTLLHLESNIVVQFMHPNWTLLRKPWVQAVQLCQAPRDFSRALCVLQACIKSAVWVPAWHEQLGHVKLIRTTAAEREERKKLDKREKKEKDEEEERYRNAFNFVKYSLGLRHQVWKQKGEEYRIHGQWGLLWNSSTRKHKKVFSNQKLSLLDGPAKIAVRVREGNIIKVLAVEPKTYEYLTNGSCDNKEVLQKLPASMQNLTIEKENNCFEEIDVEKALSSSARRYYPKIAKKTKLDDLLARRTYLKLMEEKKHANIKSNIKKEESDIKNEDERNIDVENDESEPDTSSVCNLDEEPKKDDVNFKRIEYLKEKYLDINQLTKHYKCYSLACSKIDMQTIICSSVVTINCYSPLCIKKEKILNELLTLKGGISQTVVSNNFSKDSKISILEQYLLGKSMKPNENTNILSDLLSAVACAQECDNNVSDIFVKRKFSAGDIDMLIKSEKEDHFKSESTLEESAVPAVGNEMDIDISCNNDENEVEIGPLKELTDTDNPDVQVDDNDSDRPPIPKLKITRGRSSKNNNANINNETKDSNYQCSLKNLDKPKYRAVINRRFGLGRPLKREETIIKEEKTESGDTKVYSTENPRYKVYLKKVQTSAAEKKKKRTPVKYPPCSTFHTRSKAKTLMVLPLHELKKVSKQGGLVSVQGFSSNAKPNQAVWPYPCPRPLFKTCWLYRTVNLQWLASAALQLRTMWSCLRWEDMAAKAANADGKHQLTTDTEIVSLELLKHRHLGLFMERTQYLRRKVVIPLELPKTIREVTSIRSGLRKRKRAESPQNTEPQVSEEWVDEDKLELWEIRQYGERSEKGTPVTRTTTGKLPIRTQTVTSVTHAGQTPAIDIKDKMEQQLREQRAAHHQKRALEMAQDKSKTPTQISGKSTLTSLLTNNSSTPTGGQKTIIGTRRIIMTKGADGTTRVVTQPMVTTKPEVKTAAHKDGPQKVQILRTPDGKLSVSGLLANQQLIQMPDGKLHIVMSGQQQGASGLATKTITKAEEEIEEPKKSTPARHIVIQQSPQMVVQSGGRTVQTMVVQRGARPTPPAATPRPRMTLVPATVPPTPSPSTPAPAAQQIVVNNPALVQQIAAGKIHLATVNGHQVLIRPTGNNQAQIVAHIGQSPAPAAAPTAAPAPSNVPSPAAVQTTPVQTPLTEDQIMEKRLLAGQPPGTVIKTVTAQVMQTSNGPRIVLQGLHGYSLAPQQLALVQNQIKQQLLKAQESTGKQGILGPLKIYLAVQPPQPQQMNVQAVQSPAPALAITQTVPMPALAHQETNVNKAKQIILNGEEHLNLKSLIIAKQDALQKDITNVVKDQNNKFVLTPDYISQTIKSALKQENLNPEIEEKLIQLQKYQEKRQGGISERIEREVRVIEREREKARVVEQVESPPSSPEPARRRPPRDDDDDWIESSPRKRSRALPRPVSPRPTPAPPPVVVQQVVRTPVKAVPTPAPPPIIVPAPTPPAPVNAVEEKRRAASTHSRLQMLLFKHKELLKKDIMKKRGLLEKELGVEIQKELSTELALRTRFERTKQEEVRTGVIPSTPSTPSVTSANNARRRRRPARPSPNPARPPQQKREKLLCICRTPYDNTKFYVGCEHCNNWFHGSCVGVSEEMSREMEEFVCSECRRAADTQELYCLCRQPYDNKQFYICCDRCQDWFHGRCVGILQSEADNIDEYVCPNCQKNNTVNLANMKELTQKDFDNLRRLVKQIQLHKSAWPFMEPVDPREAPTYYKIIKEPMDLQTVERKVNEQTYSMLSDFIGDMTKIFDNCRYFNPKDSEFFRCADSLEAFFAQKIKYFREKIFESTQ